MTSFGLVGSGWRAEFFLRVARALPRQFAAAGVVARCEERAARLAAEYGVRCFPSVEALLAQERPACMVVAVNSAASTEVVLHLARRGCPVLMETPAAPDLEALERLHRGLPKGALVQVAEQYPFQPMHAARLAFLATGRLGAVQQVQLSYTHSYHAMALIRQYLGVGFENADITAATLPVSVVAGPGRAGPPQQACVTEKEHTVAVLDFGGKSAIFSFEDDQHRSWVRSPLVQVKGERGEVFNEGIKYLLDFATPMRAALARVNLGEDENLEGQGLKGILGDGRWLYRNPWPEARLADDELAVAACMDAMARHLQGGAGFYSLAQASQDLYLARMTERAAQQGCRLRTETQPWAG